MIIAVKGKDYKRIAIKAFSVIGLISMFYAYYLHMSNFFQHQNEILVKKLDQKGTDKKNELARQLEKLIYKEAEMAVFLIGQTHVKVVKIVEQKLYIECDYNTDIEPLLVRYGANALIKSSANDIKIAIDLKFIVENKYEA